MDQTREWKGLHLAVGQKYFHVSNSKILDIQTSCNSINPDGLRKTSDAGGIHPLEGVERGERATGINHTSAHVLDIGSKGGFRMGCHGVR